MIWANFLHFYQPPTQKRYWVDRITDEAYRRILHELERAPNARVTMNIAAVLVELWDKWGHQDVIDGYRKLLEKGQIELTGSAKYHPLLPRIPKSEIVRQIKLNEETLERYFGVKPLRIKKSEIRNKNESNIHNSEFIIHNSLRGFFPPEMAYDRKVAEAVAEMGYEWIIAEELSFSREFNKVDYRKIYEIKGIQNSEFRIQNSNLKIFFRQRDISYKILSGQLGTANLFLKELGERINQDNYLLTAMDGETFGHHRPGMEKLLFELYKTPNLKTCLISKLPQYFKEIEMVETRPSTWALMEKDIEKNAPFARWEDPGNEIHEMQWELTNLAIETVNKTKFAREKCHPELVSGSKTSESLQPSRFRNKFGMTKKSKRWLKAREMLDRALHSDQYWWACARPWWSLEMIERGAKELMDTILIVPDASEKTRQKAKDLYFRIITTGFGWQRTGKVEEMSRKEDEEIRMRTDEGLPKLPKEELEKIIANIRREMKECAEKEEYERAAQLRDRIRELREYTSK